MSNPIPQGKYVIASRYGDLIWTAGMTPRVDGIMLRPGKVSGDEPSLEVYRESVAQAAANALSAAKSKLHEGEQIKQILRMTAYIAANTAFTRHAELADMASDYLYNQLGPVASCARVSVGVAGLPGNAPIEIQLLVAVGK
ncbi:MAG TPA: RidA family protein [Bacillota bacterium]|nr:RidA family protein [Bacillota bacterium]